MNKKLLSLAIATAFAAPLAQASEMSVYGVAHVALSSFDNQAGVNAGSDYWDLASHESRLGVKGSEDLGNGLKAIYKMEFEVQMADADNTINNGDNAGQMTARNTYVGLAADWGTFLMGRHDTPLKISTGALDLFDGTIADYNNVASGGDDQGVGGAATTARSLEFINVRADNAIAYVSPNMNGLTLAAAIVTPGESTVTGADNVLADELAEAVSVAAMYSNGPFYASLAYEDYSDAIVSTVANRGFDVTRLGLGYTANNFHVGFVYETLDAGAGMPAAGTLNDRDIWQLSGSYTFGNNVVKAMYGERDQSDVTGADIEQFAVGVDHMFSKKTKAYAVYTDVNSSIATMDWSGLSFGLSTSF